ncbi:unnamed protein product [Ceratitis capitata]|uniref:(Mediterranean fruit fly) hypothetical protein n=1 Tax=Ceratitis capitata TaxID=7213 RepID=A0A811U7D2_CERCA|nr:unnamed protein product [Ceratitis capitata]
MLRRQRKQAAARNRASKKKRKKWQEIINTQIEIERYEVYTYIHTFYNTATQCGSRVLADMRMFVCTRTKGECDIENDKYVKLYLLLLQPVAFATRSGCV